jgi:hypothetical protein
MIKRSRVKLLVWVAWGFSDGQINSNEAGFARIQAGLEFRALKKYLRN